MPTRPQPHYRHVHSPRLHAPSVVLAPPLTPIYQNHMSSSQLTCRVSIKPP